MHPAGGTQYLPMVAGFARSGVHVLTCSSRYPRNDSALIMEKVACDLGAAVRHAARAAGLPARGAGRLVRRRLAVAVLPVAGRTTHRHATPAGDGSLTHPRRPAAGRRRCCCWPRTAAVRILTSGWTRPSSTRPTVEARRLARPVRPGPAAARAVSGGLLARFRAAQLARNRRITAWVQDKLAAMRRAGRDDQEFCFVVHGTMAEPAWLDPSIDPNGRVPGTCFMGDPRMVNDAPAGLARYTSLRSWLSAVCVRPVQRRRRQGPRPP